MEQGILNIEVIYQAQESWILHNSICLNIISDVYMKKLDKKQGSSCFFYAMLCVDCFLINYHQLNLNLWLRIAKLWKKDTEFFTEALWVGVDG